MIYWYYSFFSFQTITQFCRSIELVMHIIELVFERQGEVFPHRDFIKSLKPGLFTEPCSYKLYCFALLKAANTEQRIFLFEFELQFSKLSLINLNCPKKDVHHSDLFPHCSVANVNNIYSLSWLQENTQFKLYSSVSIIHTLSFLDLAQFYSTPPHVILEY